MGGSVSASERQSEYASLLPFGKLEKKIRVILGRYRSPRSLWFFVEANGENANKFNEHLELILDFMGVLEHEPELMERLKIKHNLS